MDESNIEREVYTNEVGYIAQVLDSEMTITERMKINKHNLLGIVGAIIIYFVTMSIFALLL